MITSPEIEATNKRLKIESQIDRCMNSNGSISYEDLANNLQKKVIDPQLKDLEGKLKSLEEKSDIAAKLIQDIYDSGIVCDEDLIERIGSVWK